MSSGEYALVGYGEYDTLVPDALSSECGSSLDNEVLRLDSTSSTYQVRVTADNEVLRLDSTSSTYQEGYRISVGIGRLCYTGRSIL